MSGIKNLILAIMLVTVTGLLMVFLMTYQARAGNVIRIAHDSKESSPLHQALLLFEQQVETESQGEMVVEIYPARQVGGVRETTELVQQGNLQMTVGASVLLTSIVPEFNVLDMFYLFRDVEHAHRALDSDAIGGLLLKAMENKGFHGLGFMEVGFRSITSNKRSINTFADLNGLKIRAASNPVQIEAWKSVGTAPTPLSWGEIFTSLQQGLINTQESSIYSIYAERFYEAQEYLSLTDHIYTNYVWFVNKVYWDGLNDQHQAIINRASNSAIAKQRVLAAELNSQIIDVLEEHGMRINVVDAGVRAEMKLSMNKAVYDVLRSKTGPKLFDDLFLRINEM
jgi:tripartite ATP-independent transporter DctP family solute receptor